MSNENKVEQYAIEKGLPIPDTMTQRATKYPFAKMEVGDSFFIPLTTQPKASARSSLYMSIRAFNKANNKDFEVITRIIDNGMRVWRFK